MRKYHVSLSLILQATSQLERIYGHFGAKTILNGGTFARLVLPGCDHETAENCERMIGKRVTSYTSPDGRTFTEMLPLLSANLIRTMEDDEALFLARNRNPKEDLKVIPYYKNRRLL